MAIQQYYVGDSGPFYYDDAVLYEDGSPQQALYTPGGSIGIGGGAGGLVPVSAFTQNGDLLVGAGASAFATFPAALTDDLSLVSDSGASNSMAWKKLSELVITAATIALTRYQRITVVTTNAPLTITLPLPLESMGFIYVIKHTGAIAPNTTVTTSGGANIDGGGPAILNVIGQRLLLISDGDNWFTL